MFWYRGISSKFLYWQNTAILDESSWNEALGMSWAGCLTQTELNWTCGSKSRQNPCRFSPKATLVQCTACNHRAALAFARDSSKVFFTALRTFWGVKEFWLCPCCSGSLSVHGGQRVRPSNCYKTPKITKPDEMWIMILPFRQWCSWISGAGKCCLSVTVHLFPPIHQK